MHKLSPGVGFHMRSETGESEGGDKREREISFTHKQSQETREHS